MLEHGSKIRLILDPCSLAAEKIVAHYRGAAA